MKLLTRRQIIEEWAKQPDEMLDTSYCPQRRNLLHEYGDRYFCENRDCSQGYILKTEVVLL